MRLACAGPEVMTTSFGIKCSVVARLTIKNVKYKQFYHENVAKRGTPKQRGHWSTMEGAQRGRLHGPSVINYPP